MQELHVSARGLKQAVEAHDKNFVLFVGREKMRYDCHTFQICFFSKNIAQIIAHDPLLDCYHILQNESAADFSFIEQLLNGEPLTLNTEIMHNLLKLSAELGNTEISSALIEMTNTEEISITNCVSRIEIKAKHNLDYDAEVAFIARNFARVKSECSSDLSILTIDQVEAILDHEELRARSENQLLDFVLERMQTDPSYGSLLRYIHFEDLEDDEHITAFLEKVFPNFIDDCLWKRMVNLQVDAVRKRPPPSCDTKRYLKEFKYDPSAPVNGIITELRKRCGGANPHSKLVNVTASTTDGQSTKACYGVLDYTASPWYSRNDKNSDQWWQCDFMEDRAVSLTSYTIRSSHRGCDNLARWELRGSNDGSNWTVLDSKSTQALNGGDFVRVNFACSNEHCDKFWRYIQLQTNGSVYRTDTNNTWRLQMSEIEFFGALWEK